MHQHNTESRSSEHRTQKDDRLSYVMLFCALMVARKSQATVQQSLEVVPLSGAAKRLADEFANRDIARFAPGTG